MINVNLTSVFVKQVSGRKSDLQTFFYGYARRHPFCLVRIDFISALAIFDVGRYRAVSKAWNVLYAQGCELSLHFTRFS